MDSLLPVAQAPILRMSGGSMSMLPAVPASHAPMIAMSGGASLLPVAPDVPIAGMHGGAKLYPIRDGYIHNISDNAVHVASFGIKSLSEEEAPERLPCAPIEEGKTVKVCDSLQPFVDRRVQALLRRVRFPSGDAKVDMGCGTITRTGSTLQIKFHEKAITLLSCDLTGTFAAFHKDMQRHQPGPVKNRGVDILLSWMLGSPITEKGDFQLVPFMESMKTTVDALPLEGFRRFLSYHKDKVEEADVMRYAMELYGYRTGDVTNTNDIYGLILPPHTAVRRTGDTFAVYQDGKVTQGTWDPAWTSQGGFAVYAPAS